jgi:hypothetical protein
MFNRVIKTYLQPEETNEKINEIKEFFASKSLPFTWQVDPGNQPFDLAERLEKAGLIRQETPGMANQIENLVKPKSPEGFSYQKVTTPSLNEVYTRILPDAYGMPEIGWDWVSQFFKHLGIVDYFVHYLGYLDGKPVATSSVLYGDGVAALYNVSNLPETRRKGIGSIMSYVPFIDARKQNYQIGILHSTPMGYNMYKRLGFKEICKVIRYQWDPSL